MRELNPSAGAAFLPTATALAADIEKILLERSVFVTNVEDEHSAPLLIGKPTHPPTHIAIRQLVEAGLPIQMVLPAFPAKSANRHKTMSHLPDLGEWLALKYLNDVCRRIASIYYPGARCIICSDGHVFSDLVGVSDGEVDEYGDSLRSMILAESFNHLSDFSLLDYYRSQSFSGFESLRRQLTEEFATDLSSLKLQIFTNDDRKSTFNGIHRFLFEDMLVLNNAWSRNKTRKEAKLAAYEVVRRSDAWSRLVTKTFPQAVRLSIHPHTKATSKLGIKLVDGGGPWATPWHNVVIKKNNRYQLIKRCEAEQAGATLKFVEGKYAFYEL